MSHVTDMRLKVIDLDCAEQAAQEAGLVLRRDQKTHKWYGRFVGDSHAYGDHDPKDFGKCDHALQSVTHRPGDYEIGLVPSKTGKGWDTVVDTWGPGAKLVAPLATFRREYAVAVATKKAKLALRGARVVRENLPGNRVRLRLMER